MPYINKMALHITARYITELETHFFDDVNDI